MAKSILTDTEKELLLPISVQLEKGFKLTLIYPIHCISHVQKFVNHKQKFINGIWNCICLFFFFTITPNVPKVNTYMLKNLERLLQEF